MSDNKNIKYCECCGLQKQIVCNTCGKKKPPTDFHAGKKICKVCRAKYNQERYQKKVKAKKEKNEVQIVNKQDSKDVCLN